MFQIHTDSVGIPSQYYFQLIKIYIGLYYGTVLFAHFLVNFCHVNLLFLVLNLQNSQKPYCNVTWFETVCPTKLREGNVSVVSVCSSDHYRWHIGPHCSGPPFPPSRTHAIDIWWPRLESFPQICSNFFTWEPYALPQSCLQPTWGPWLVHY